MASYAFVVRCDFIDMDDTGYVIHNPFIKEGLTWQGIQTAFTTFYGSLWIPLTWLSFMLDISLFGMDAGAFHLENAIIHAVTTGLLFLTLRRSTGATWRSAIVAALFGVHPINVESVAWVTERKNVLCALFAVLSIDFYLRAGGRPKSRWFLAAVAAHALALMAKPMAVVLPGLLFLLDFWPLNRDARQWFRLLLEKVPFAVLTLGACYLALLAPHENEAWVTAGTLPFSARSANALVSYVEYLRDLAWPSQLATFYPHPIHIRPVITIGSAALLIAITLLVIGCRKTRPYLLVGWLWFLAALIPTIGLVQVGSQARADRFTYLAQIGLFFGLTWWVADILPSKRRAMAFSLAVIAIIAFAIQTTAEVRYWTNTLTLFERAIENTGPNACARMVAGRARARIGDLEAAAAHFESAIRIQPDLSSGWAELGKVLSITGNQQNAAKAYTVALRHEPGNSEYRTALANLEQALARPEARVPH
jgi:tetratricopeptide (TPR) repeat protein